MFQSMLTPSFWVPRTVYVINVLRTWPILCDAQGGFSGLCCCNGTNLPHEGRALGLQMVQNAQLPARQQELPVAGL